MKFPTITAFQYRQREIMAIACCYAEFISEQGTKKSPISYWRGVTEENRSFYRRQAKALIALVQTMPQVRA